LKVTTFARNHEFALLLSPVGPVIGGKGGGYHGHPSFGGKALGLEVEIARKRASKKPFTHSFCVHHRES